MSIEERLRAIEEKLGINSHRLTKASFTHLSTSNDRIVQEVIDLVRPHLKSGASVHCEFFKATKEYVISISSSDDVTERPPQKAKCRTLFCDEIVEKKADVERIQRIVGNISMQTGGTISWNVRENVDGSYRIIGDIEHGI